MSLYAAYGSNLNKAQMLKRCPKSVPFTSIVLNRFRLSFKGVADVEISKTHNVFFGIYKISNECEKSLDGYEEFPTIYKKYYFNHKLKGKDEKVMYYAMNKSFDYAVPSIKYFNVIKQGFKDWGFSLNNLVEAGLHSLKNNSLNGYKSLTWYNQHLISNEFLNSIK